MSWLTDLDIARCIAGLLPDLEDHWLGEGVSPYHRDITEVLKPFPWWRGDGEDSFAWTYEIVIDAGDVPLISLPCGRPLFEAMPKLQSKRCVLFSLSSVCKAAAFEALDGLTTQDDTRWRILPDATMAPIPALQGWCAAMGIAVLDHARCQKPVADLGPPLPPDTPGVVSQYLFGLGPEYGRGFREEWSEKEDLEWILARNREWREQHGG